MLVGTVEQTLSRLGAPLELAPDERVLLDEHSQQLVDAKTSRLHLLTFEYPYKEASHGQNDWKMLGPALLRSLDPPR